MGTASAYEKLPCKLTEAEKLKKSDELARELRRHAELELEKTLTAQRLAKAIKESDRRIADLGEEIRTGIEHRDVPVRQEVSGSRMITIRVDTQTEISSRPLEQHERQRELFGSAAPMPRPEAGPGDDDDDDDDDGDAAVEH